MKKVKLPLIIVIILTFGRINNSNAQNQTSGLYLALDDYLHRSLCYSTDPVNPKGNKIFIHEFLGRNNVIVVSNGRKLSFSKSKIFGYHDSYNNDYRFFDNKAYQIIDTAGFYIYSYDKFIQQGKGPKPTRIYYFSRNASDQILLLTPENIAKAFPKNHKFRNMINTEYQANTKLDAYSNVSQEYKIKALYAESFK